MASMVIINSTFFIVAFPLIISFEDQISDNTHGTLKVSPAGFIFIAELHTVSVDDGPHRINRNPRTDAMPAELLST